MTIGIVACEHNPFQHTSILTELITFLSDIQQTTYNLWKTVIYRKMWHDKAFQPW